MKIRMAGWALLALVLAAAPAWAESNLKVGFIDSQEVVRSFPAYIEANEELQKAFVPRQEAVLEKEREIERLNQEVKKNLLLSEESKAQKRKEVEEKMKALMELKEMYTKEMEEKRDDLLKPLQDMIENVIESVAKQNGYTLVYDVAVPPGLPIIYIDDQYDITKLVVAELEKKAKAKREAKKE